MSKRILSIVLALALAVSCFAVSAFALGEAAYEEEGNTYTQEWSISEAAQNDNDVWYVEVSLTANYTVGAIQFALDISNPNITIKEVIASKQDGTAGAITAEYGADVGYDTTGASNKVAIIPNPEEDGAAAIDFSAGGVVCTVFFTIANEATGTVQIVNDPKSASNPGGSLIAARIDDGVLATGTSYTGQTVTVATDARLVGSSMLPADLEKTAAAEAGILIDTAHTFGGAYKGVVYGFTQKAASTFMNTGYLTNALQATNGGSLAFSRSIGASGYGTGTVITVSNSDGTESCRYVVVIFGDVDGNGLTNANDTATTKKAALKASYFANNSVQRMAANCQMVAAVALMHTINANDTATVKAHVTGKKVDQAALAAKMATLTAYYI